MSCTVHAKEASQSQPGSLRLSRTERRDSHVARVLARIDAADTELCATQTALGLLRDIGRADKVH